MTKKVRQTRYRLSDFECKVVQMDSSDWSNGTTYHAKSLSGFTHFVLVETIPNVLLQIGILCGYRS